MTEQAEANQIESQTGLVRGQAKKRRVKGLDNGIKSIGLGTNCPEDGKVALEMGAFVGLVDAAKLDFEGPSESFTGSFGAGGASFGIGGVAVGSGVDEEGTAGSSVLSFVLSSPLLMKENMDSAGIGIAP